MKCDECGEDKPDALKRVSGYSEKTTFEGSPIGFDPVLCAKCCAKYPRREWMRDSLWAK